MSSSQVEGLLPFLYKAIKDRRRSSSTSRPAFHAGADNAQAEDEDDHGAVDLGDTEQRRRWLEQELRSPIRAAGPSSSSAAAAEGHGRNRSLEELAGQVGGTPDRRLRVPLPKARSVRVFSCIGAA
ncbi:uncharacterized protein LOC124649648 [Lolium rigidum]|uniref:uncharacterized protein LOC124649648 n=1 Tax=Lolium rigidum TaxID=89674 RepID=UPI001F5DC16E|nr:uncharacterized protein LOC124649648 [Lolium rigidum]